MRKGQQQIRCSSGVSIAGRINSRLQIQDLPPQKMRGPKGQQQVQVLEMVKSEEDVVVHLPPADDTGRPLQGKDVLHLLDGDAAPLHPPHDVADLLLPLDAGLRLPLPVVDLHHPDDILPLFSVATAPHLCLYKSGSCLALLQNALHQGSSDAPQGLLSAEALLLRGDAHLHLPLPHLDTEGAPCCLLPVQAGIYDPLWEQQAASPLHLQIEVALSGVPLVHRGVLICPVHLHLSSGDSTPLHTVANQFAECPALQSHAITRDPLAAHSL